MISETEQDFTWLDEAPAATVRKPKRRVKKAKRKPAKTSAKAAAPAVKGVTKIDHDAIRGHAMFSTVNGRKRIWACDGEYVFFRRKLAEATRDSQGQKHTAIARHQRFIDRGDYIYVETQDDVEICRVAEHSPLYRKGVYLGQLSEGGLNRAAAIAACKRDWVLYTDVLEQLASVVKGKWSTAGQATLCWNERLQYIDQMIAARGGPSPIERGQALAQVRQARGDGKGKVILLGR